MSAPNEQQKTPRLLRSIHVTPWADRNAVYPADAAKLAFEDAVTSDYAREFWTAQLSYPALVAENKRLREALELITKSDTFAGGPYKVELERIARAALAKEDV